ncbi:MAG: alpha/beta fold hydrolase [Candidatus Odinarchaeota archaeon]
MPRMMINGADLYYEDTGSGNETVVFSHGLLWSCRMFDKQVEFLKDRYRVVTYDHRGQGQTAVTESGYDMDTLMQDAAELIERLGIAPVHMAGLSMGGFVAMRLAARRPELVKSLILIETSADPEPAENVPKYKRLNTVARWLGLRPVTGPVMKIMFGQTFLNDPTREEDRQYWKKQLLSNSRKGITRAVLGVTDRKGIYEELGNIKCPTLIIVGDEDVATVSTKSERIRDAIKGSQLVVIPRAGHTSTVEEPEAVTKAINEFLTNL